MEFLGLIWNEAVIRPLTNTLLLLYVLLFNNLGLAIVAFTLLARGITYPLTLRQLRQTQKMQQLQPRMREISERYKNDPQKKGQETMRLYKEMGVNPIGCLGPMVIQMPILIGLFWAVQNVLPTTPERMAELGTKLYSWLPMLNEVIPVNRHFLGMDLGLEPMRSLNVLALFLVAVSAAAMYVQQKMTVVKTTDPAQASQQQMMTVMMPLMFGGFGLFFPTGVLVYWVVSNIIGIVIQYFVTGWGGLRSSSPAAAGLAPSLAAPAPVKESSGNGTAQPRPNGQDRGGSDRDRASGARRRSRRSRGRRP
ncbi:MAG: YidC/Oxa1 family membrane protein insertase [SAR202 cluster bacterium]|nr:YidC/Oxa1 family membrane protein insertase [SAR202 cluster bacterium]